MVRAGASACAMASDAKSAIAAAIRSATSTTLRRYSQASEMAAAASGVATTVPAAAARGLTGLITSAWLPRKIGTIAVNQCGGVLPSPTLWPQSGLSNAMAGWNSTQTPGEISFIVSRVRQSGTGKSCSRVLLLRNKNSCQYSA